MRFDIIAFDADDTLWHNERLFSMTQVKFKALLSRYTTNPNLDTQLYQTEIRNLRYFGYGIKGFTLSMIETAIELTNGKIQGHDIQQLIDYAREMLSAPVDLLPHVEKTITRLHPHYPLMIITKGDLLDQENKIARSGLANYFTHIEIVSHKTPAIYSEILARHGYPADRFLMVGNSLKSDVLPVLELGGQAVHVPYHTTWAHEMLSEGDAVEHQYPTRPHLAALLPWLAENDPAFSLKMTAD
jgi:putative hydrolase of the HAD superfamily